MYELFNEKLQLLSLIFFLVILKFAFFSTNNNKLFFNSFYVLLEIGSCYVAQTGLELLIFLPRPPEWQDYRCAPVCLVVFFAFLRQSLM